MKAVEPASSFIYDGCVINIYQAKKGEGLPQHIHSYAHATFCINGSCVIRKEGVEKIMQLGVAPVNLKENEWHEIEALENGTVFVNVFSEGKT